MKYMDDVNFAYLKQADIPEVIIIAATPAPLHIKNFLLYNNLRYNMKMNNATEQFFNRLQQQIEKAELENKPIQGMVKQPIKLLQQAHDEFVSTAKRERYDMRNPKLGEIEVRQYSAMKQLAQKIGLPVDEYDNLIKQVKIRVFGEENYKRFF